VLAIFLGGLSIGYSVFSRVSGRITRGSTPEASGRRLLFLYGLVEEASAVGVDGRNSSRVSRTLSVACRSLG
jgi:hypothetical protein